MCSNFFSPSASIPLAHAYAAPFSAPCNWAPLFRQVLCPLSPLQTAGRRGESTKGWHAHSLHHAAPPTSSIVHSRRQGLRRWATCDHMDAVCESLCVYAWNASIGVRCGYLPEPTCGHAVSLLLTGRVIVHKIGWHSPRTGELKDRYRAGMDGLAIWRYVFQLSTPRSRIHSFATVHSSCFLVTRVCPRLDPLRLHTCLGLASVQGLLQSFMIRAADCTSSAANPGVRCMYQQL